jgi:amidophosphoribosyltransferase
MSTYRELIGARLTVEEMAEELGANSVNYMPVDEYIRETGMRRDQLCIGCISNEYPTNEANRIAHEIRESLEKGHKEKGRAYE